VRKIAIVVFLLGFGWAVAGAISFPMQMRSLVTKRHAAVAAGPATFSQEAVSQELATFYRYALRDSPWIIPPSLVMLAGFVLLAVSCRREHTKV
jgi:hypothetical protein